MLAVADEHPLLDTTHPHLESLAEHSFVMFPPELNYRLNEIVLAACSAAGFAPSISQVAAQMHTQLALVGAGFGIAFVPWWVASANFQNVHFIQLHGSPLNYELDFLWRSEDQNPALQHFVSLIRERPARRLGPRRTAAGLTRGRP